jgi:hypothetical protein
MSASHNILGPQNPRSLAIYGPRVYGAIPSFSAVPKLNDIVSPDDPRCEEAAVSRVDPQDLGREARSVASGG